MDREINQCSMGIDGYISSMLPSCKSCECGNSSPRLQYFSLGDYCIMCSECGKCTDTYLSTNDKHAVIIAIEAWNDGKIYKNKEES